MSLFWSFPAALILLAGVPLYLWLARRGGAGIPIPRSSMLADPPGRVITIARLPAALRAATLVLLVLAMAGPRTAGAVVEERTGGVPVVISLDISSSMLAQDFQPQDRLEVAKSTISQFISAREADPIGLVAFAGEALTLVPVTTNSALLINAIESLRIGLLEDGTAIGDGLAAAVNRVRGVDAQTRVVILLSDGENNRGIIDPLAAADAAAAVGIQVFTIGVGTDGVAQVPVGRAPEGFRYAELPVGLDEELLREIARRTGGQYFRADDPEALQRIYGEIDRLVPSVFQTTRYQEHQDWAFVLLLLAAATLVGEWGVRGSRWGVVP
jgi:Ca-activated chloride channel homolog